MCNFQKRERGRPTHRKQRDILADAAGYFSKVSAIEHVPSGGFLLREQRNRPVNSLDLIDGGRRRLNNRGMTQPTPLPTNTPTVAPTSVPTSGALIGLDFGTKRLGVAVCNFEQSVAVPVETWQVRTPEQNIKHLRELIEDYRAVGFVIGLPVRLDGIEGDQAVIVRRFGKWLSENTQRPVSFWDERHSSSQAELLLWQQGISPEQGKDRLDKLAAQIILQSFLDAPDRSVAPQPTEGSSFA